MANESIPLSKVAELNTGSPTLFRHSTHLIPSPESQGEPLKRYVSPSSFYVGSRLSSDVGILHDESLCGHLRATSHGCFGTWVRDRHLYIKCNWWFVSLSYLVLGLENWFSILGFKVPQNNVFGVFGNVTPQFLAASRLYTRLNSQSLTSSHIVILSNTVTWLQSLFRLSTYSFWRLILPIAIAWRDLDWILRRYQVHPSNNARIMVTWKAHLYF